MKDTIWPEKLVLCNSKGAGGRAEGGQVRGSGGASREGRGREGLTSNQNEKCKPGADASMFRSRCLSFGIFPLFSSKFSAIFRLQVLPWQATSPWLLTRRTSIKLQEGFLSTWPLKKKKKKSWLRSDCKWIWLKLDFFSNPIYWADCPHCF